MRFLAIDLGIHSGWACNEPFNHGVEDFTLSRGESRGIIFLKFNRWLLMMNDLVKPSVIIFEQPHTRGGYATEILVGMSTRILDICATIGIESMSVHSATLKKFATGSGKSKKPDMLLALSKTGISVEDDNECDAIWLLKYAEDTLCQEKTPIRSQLNEPSLKV